MTSHPRLSIVSHSESPLVIRKIQLRDKEIAGSVGFRRWLYDFDAEVEAKAALARLKDELYAEERTNA